MTLELNALRMSNVNRDELIEAAGMQIVICMRNEHEDNQWQTTAEAGFWIGIVLSGAVVTTSLQAGKQVWRENTKHAFWSDGNLVMNHNIASTTTPFVAIFIHITTTHTHDLFDKGEFEILQQRGSTPLLLESTAVERTLAWRILGAKSVGLERKLYITSRAIDLISSAVSSFYKNTKTPPTISGKTNLSATEIKRIYALSNDLLAEPNCPPSASELARQVGMNVRKLNSGFRTLFGVTMNGFIIQSRLDKARVLLEAGELNVAQVADSVGYDPAHFSTVFRKRFGLPPSAYGKSNDK